MSGSRSATRPMRPRTTGTARVVIILIVSKKHLLVATLFVFC